MQQIHPMQAYNTTALATEADIQGETEEDLLNLEQNVNELKTIAEEVLGEVKTSEVAVVRIATNVTSAADNVQSGTAAVQKASGYQRKKCCIA